MMQVLGLRAISRRKFTTTTRRDRSARPAPDLVDRNFKAEEANRLWVADITYMATWAGFLYLAVVLDVWSRKIVGWSMRTDLKSELVLEALEMAVRQRRPLAAATFRDSVSFTDGVREASSEDRLIHKIA